LLPVPPLLPALKGLRFQNHHRRQRQMETAPPQRRRRMDWKQQGLEHRMDWKRRGPEHRRDSPKLLLSERPERRARQMGCSAVQLLVVHRRGSEKRSRMVHQKGWSSERRW
jgi:hypothetical protein